MSTKGIVPLISISRLPPFFLWQSSRTAAHPGVISGLVLLVSLVSWIAAMSTLLLWRKVCSSVIFRLISFAFHCIRRRQLVGVGVETGQGSFRYRRHTGAEFGAAVSASAAPPPKAILRVEKVRKFWLSTVSVGDPSRRGNFHSFLVCAVINNAVHCACELTILLQRWASTNQMQQW